MILHVLLLALTADTPCILWSNLPDQYASAVENIGDINENGTDDVVVLSQDASESVLWCFDGRTSQVLWVTSGLPEITDSRCLVSTPDMDGDGIGDIALGGGETSRDDPDSVFAFSGFDGSKIWSKPMLYGCHVADMAVSPGPLDEPPMVHVSLVDGYFRHFLSLDGDDGYERWSVSVVTFNSEIHTIPDCNGNGWGEMGYSINRGSVSGGGCYVRDGRGGPIVYSTSAMYYCSMDLCDSPEPMIAVGQTGYPPDFRLETVPGGAVLFDLYWGEAFLGEVQGVSGVDGGPLPTPILMGWEEENFNFIAGPDGDVYPPCTFPFDVKRVESFQVTPATWAIAVLTARTFHVMDPVLYSTPGPSCDLPSLFGVDLCLLASDQYPTPLAAVALSGTPGLCVLVTSWPEGIGESTPAADPHVRLARNPSTEGLNLVLTKGFEGASIIDISGRQVVRIEAQQEGEVFVDLSPGVYFVLTDTGNTPPLGAVVIAQP